MVIITFGISTNTRFSATGIHDESRKKCFLGVGHFYLHPEPPPTEPLSVGTLTIDETSAAAIVISSLQHCGSWLVMNARVK